MSSSGELKRYFFSANFLINSLRENNSWISAGAFFSKNSDFRYFEIFEIFRDFYFFGIFRKISSKIFFSKNFENNFNFLKSFFLMIQKNNRFKTIWTFDSANNLCGNISADLVLPSINENVSYNFRYFRWFSVALGHPPPWSATRAAGLLGSPSEISS